MTGSKTTKSKKNRCKYVFIQGTKSGKKCGINCRGDYCKNHNKNRQKYQKKYHEKKKEKIENDRKKSLEEKINLLNIKQICSLIQKQEIKQRNLYNDSKVLIGKILAFKEKINPDDEVIATKIKSYDNEKNRSINRSYRKWYNKLDQNNKNLQDKLDNLINNKRIKLIEKLKVAKERLNLFNEKRYELECIETQKEIKKNIKNVKKIVNNMTEEEIDTELATEYESEPEHKNRRTK